MNELALSPRQRNTPGLVWVRAGLSWEAGRIDVGTSVALVRVLCDLDMRMFVTGMIGST